MRLGEPVSGKIGKDDPALCARWIIPLTIDAGKLPPGTHETRVEVLSGWWRTTVAASVPVEVTVVPPIEVAPSQLFFGSVKRGQPAEVSFTVRSGAIPAQEIRMTHNLKEQLEFKQVATGPGASTWRATLTPNGRRGAIQGTLTLRAVSDDTAATEIPILARVQPDERP